MFSNIKSIEFELTTDCNARCPQCARNYFGSYKWPTVPDTKLDLRWIKDKIPYDIYDDLDYIRLCGTYGDPAAHPDVLRIVEFFKDRKVPLVINTNGGMKTTRFWSNLAHLLTNEDKVYFGIDGLADTHSLHRVNTKFDKVVKNLKAFNDAGGKSIVSFLIFEHNEHQVNDVKQLAFENGASDFAVKSTSRFLSKDYRQIDQLDVLDSTGKNISHTIRPTRHPLYKNNGYDVYEKLELEAKHIRCFSKRTNSISIGADGYMMPCPWLNDRLYGFEAEKSPDRKKMFDMMGEIGGQKKAILNHTSFEEIVWGEVGWFNKVFTSQQSTTDALYRCKSQCHVDNILLDEANKYLKQSWAGEPGWGVKKDAV